MYLLHVVSCLLVLTSQVHSFDWGNLFGSEENEPTPSIINKGPPLPVHPLILIPGLSGNWVEAKLNRSHAPALCDSKSDWYKIWLDPVHLLPGAIDCFIDHFKTIFDEKTQRSLNQEGVDTRIPCFGETTSIERLIENVDVEYARYYFQLVQGLVDNQGYERNRSIRGAPYDFRKGPFENEEYFQLLTTLVEDTVKMNGGKSAVLVGHSLGGSMAQYFLKIKSQEWKDQYIRSWISIATPIGGTGEGLFTYISGNNYGVPIFTSTQLKGLEQSFSSLGLMVPNPIVFKNQTVMTINGTDYKADQIGELIDMIDNKAVASYYKQSKDLLGDIDHPGVDIMCIVGKFHDTRQSMNYNATYTFPDNGQVVMGEGDGTLNSISADYCLEWQKERTDKEMLYSVYTVNHLELIRDDTVLGDIFNYIKDINTED